jgi:hypothetical protein
MTRNCLFGATLLSCVGAFGVSVAAECPTIPIEALFANSAAVFVGRAVSQRVVTRAESAESPRGRITETTFEVEDLWKGPRSTKTLAVQTCGFHDLVTDEMIICGNGNHFDVGSRYLVFAFGDPLTASTECDQHITLLEKAATSLKWLSGQPRQPR